MCCCHSLLVLISCTVIIQGLRDSMAGMFRYSKPQNDNVTNTAMSTLHHELPEHSEERVAFFTVNGR